MFYVKELCIGNSVGKVIHVFSCACVCMYIIVLIVYIINIYSDFLPVGGINLS